MLKVQRTLTQILVSLIVGLAIGIVLGVVIGVKITLRNNEREIVSTTNILERVKGESFLVTKSVITTEEATVTIDQGSAWSNFWWGHEITAKALMQSDLGVDLSTLTAEDIAVDKTNKTIQINLPQAEIYNTSLSGDIEVSTKSGILKKLFATDNNEDYNLALNELKQKSETAVNQNTQLLTDARLAAIPILEMLLEDTGYTVSLL